MTNWKDIYENGECPDCREPIPTEAADGEECKNCGHVFVAEIREDDGGYPLNGGIEYDHLPDPDDRVEHGERWDGLS